MAQITERTWWIDMTQAQVEKLDKRDDLMLFDYALSLGYEAHTRGNLIAGLPHDSISYEKGRVHIWSAGQSYPVIKRWWIAADLIDNRYQNHREYDTLREALDAEQLQE